MYRWSRSGDGVWSTSSFRVNRRVIRGRRRKAVRLAHQLVNHSPRKYVGPNQSSHTATQHAQDHLCCTVAMPPPPLPTTGSVVETTDIQNDFLTGYSVLSAIANDNECDSFNATQHPQTTEVFTFAERDGHHLITSDSGQLKNNHSTSFGSSRSEVSTGCSKSNAKEMLKGVQSTTAVTSASDSGMLEHTMVNTVSLRDSHGHIQQYQPTRMVSDPRVSVFLSKKSPSSSNRPLNMVHLLSGDSNSLSSSHLPVYLAPSATVFQHKNSFQMEPDETVGFVPVNHRPCLFVQPSPQSMVLHRGPGALIGFSATSDKLQHTLRKVLPTEVGDDSQRIPLAATSTSSRVFIAAQLPYPGDDPRRVELEAHEFAYDSGGRQLHRCRICSRVFTVVGAFQSHVLTAHYRPKNQCAVCGKHFSRSWLLKGHMRTHTGERPYRCPFVGCERAFADKSNLRSHLLIHTAEGKNYVCTRCNRAFAQKRYLHKHRLEVCKY
jgi:Zinc finger, C2H2 type